jgi:hypothetical protein
MQMTYDISMKAVADYAPEDAALLCGVGRLICAWSMLEQRLETKITMLRTAMGDIRPVGARTRPTMAKLMTELRTMVAMRDRRNAGALHEIAAIERDMQRIERFRQLIVTGFHEPAPGGFACRDTRNNRLHISMDQLESEIVALETVGNQLLEL